VTALDGVDLDLHRGEAHALIGVNGAGKSTLIKILGSVHAADEGDFFVGGNVVAFTRPSDASRLGITVVPQDILMVPEFSIGRNILLGGEAGLARRGRLSSEGRTTVQAALAQVGATFDPDTKISSLSVPHLRLAQLARALVHPGEIMVLDEPTAVLSEPDAERLLERAMQFRSQGKAVLYVTHRISEVLRLADRITILRDGKRVGLFLRGEVSRTDIIRLMTKEVKGGSSNAEAESSTSCSEFGRPRTRIQIRELSSGRRFARVNLSVSSGQIVGIAGVQGSGMVIFFVPLLASMPRMTVTFFLMVVDCPWDRCGTRCNKGFCWFRRTVEEPQSSHLSRCAPIFVWATEFADWCGASDFVSRGKRA
jgi:ABC-type sugar transport system ATPase subunit